MSVEADRVRAIVTEIWDSMLGLEVASVEGQGTTAVGRDVYAFVQIAGAWEGAVVIECGEGAALGFACAMLQPAEGVVSEADVHDVMGELANMAGGNVKAALDVDTTLSLPTVVVGRDLDFAVPGTVEQIRVRFVAGSTPFSVVVVSRTAPSPREASVRRETPRAYQGSLLTP